MTVKRYTQIIFSILLVFILFNLIIWFLFTKEILKVDEEYHIGDLSRMSYFKSLIYKRQNIVDLVEKHFDFNEYKNVDIITIGDSFSNGGGGGKNKFYQDYIATNYNLKTLNIQPSRFGFIETVLILKNAGILEKLNPKYILIESIERSAIQRFANKIDWNILRNEEYILNNILLKNYGNRGTPPATGFINTSNFNALLYNIGYIYDDNGFFSKAYITDISKELFSSKIKNKLQFYFEDLKNIPQSIKQNVEILNDNLNRLAKELKEIGITLYFMPAVDKYNLYSKYIVNNPYPKSNFFELLRKEQKDYKFIDTKEILENMIDNNIKDVYYSDDTHWSWKASEEIFKKERFNFSNNKLK